MPPAGVDVTCPVTNFTVPAPSGVERRRNLQHFQPQAIYRAEPHLHLQQQLYVPRKGHAGSVLKITDGVVVFAPGSARLTTEVQERLDKVAKVLIDRPALRVTVAGTANLDTEHDAFQRERLNALLLAQKGQGATAFTEAEYPALLKALYTRTDMPKPRNVIGMTKVLSATEMSNLLLANLTVTPDTMRQLAAQRGVAVRDYLVSKALPIERLFLGASKASIADDRASPRAELSLAMP